MKLLFISNITGKKVGSFSMASIMAAKELGFEYHMAANFKNSSPEQMKMDEEEYGIVLHQIDFERNPIHPRNSIAYKQIVELVKREQFDFIHCNTPIGGVAGRLVGQKCDISKVIYQVHGFHFYKGAPLKNWLLYYPVEKQLARITDAIITINKEDFERAKGFRLKNNGKVFYLPGVGIDLSQYELKEETRTQKRAELGLKETDVALISMGDLIERKNYPLAIEAVAKANNTNLHYYICGQGPEEMKLRKLADDLGVSEKIHFLGFRTDIKELLRASDIFLFTSKQEGLARSLMEAMASSLPCIASRIRGNTDLIEGTNGGFLCESVDEYAEAINSISGNRDVLIQMGQENVKTVKNFSIDRVINELKRIYSEVYL